MNTQEQKKHPNAVHFTIDGEPVEIETDSLTMSQVLALVGKKPDEWYLVEKVGREQKKFEDPAQEVPISHGAKFVTVFTGPNPVS